MLQFKRCSIFFAYFFKKGIKSPKVLKTYPYIYDRGTQPNVFDF